uniref:Post-GPI attachment to proteins factor 3 n=1 Tax=Homalodisca liturata TaxID=320908 RepID=A0A1B6HVL2_9HEMI
MNKLFTLGFIFLLTGLEADASLGDSFPSYKSCVDTCKMEYCQTDGYYFKQPDGKFNWAGLIQWRCSDDCRYRCMWAIVDNFERKGWPPPQFHGKWPFIRWMGLQEPASVVFSLLNLAIHIVMFRKFRNEVRPNSPMYKVWFLYAGVCINCWVWSAIFHSRDLPLTELMDYLSAFGMVFYSLYGMIMRVLIRAPGPLSVLFTLVCVSFFINHAGYLVLDQFDYQYNMSANIAVGVLMYRQLHQE